MFRGDARTGPGQRYGLGWRRWPLDGTDISMVWHGGAKPGYFAAVILLPDRAVVFLANAYGTFHEPGLLDTGFGLATLASGAAPPKVSADHTYSAILTGLSIVATALAVLVAWSIRTLVRPAPATAHRRRLLGAAAAWTVCTAAVLYTFAIALPGHFGVGLTQIPLWTPDIGWLVYAVRTLAGVLLGCRIAVAARGLRGSRTVPEPLSVV